MTSGSAYRSDALAPDEPAQGHVVVPSILRDRSALEALTSTLRTWRAPTYPASPPNTNATGTQHSPASPRAVALDRHVHQPGMLLGDVDVVDEGRRQGTRGGQSADDDSTARGAAGEPSNYERRSEESVLWGGWDEIAADANTGMPRRVLILAYPSAGLAIWDCSSLDSFYEVLNLPSLDAALGSFASRHPLGVGVIVGAAVLPTPVLPFSGVDAWAEARPLVAVLARQEASSHVLVYSLRTHEVVHDVLIDGVGHRIQANRRHVVVATSAPLALHVLAAHSLDRTPFSPIADVAPSPFDGAPVFDLGKGGRILAYATSRAVPSSRHDPGAPARPGAGTVSQRGMFDSESQDSYGDSGTGPGGFLGDARTAGQVGGEVARRVGEGVLSGVKAIGDIGLNYWLTKNSAGGGNPNLSPSGPARTFSKSAPLPSVPGFDRRSPPLRPSTRLPTDVSAAGTVAIVDLLSFTSPPTKSARRKPRRGPAPGLKLLAHFRPYLHPLALISLAPSSSLVLTSSSQAHSFDVFELKPAVAVGVSATNGELALQDPTAVGKVWHRYRLTRGFTTAEATTASWSPDLRFVSVGTGKGTTHVYATQPFGGKADLRSHFAPKVANSLELQPLSVTLSTITRIRRVRLDTDDPAARSTLLPPCLSFLSKADSYASSFRPTPLARAPSLPYTKAGVRSPRSPPVQSTAIPILQDCLLFYPQSGTCVLDRLAAAPARTVTDGGTLDVGRLATTAASGLSQLMKNRGQHVHSAPVEPEWVVSCAAKAEWAVARQPGWNDVREELDADEPCERPFARRNVIRFSAEAEIETFSRSPRVLPRSIYRSPQFDFYALPPNHPAHARTGNFVPHLRRLEMRSEVQVRQGSHRDSDEEHSGSFDQPIMSAMQTILDSEAALVSGSPKTLTPTFPNGVAGKQGRWRDAILIPSVNEGLGRVRKELGRVRVSAIVPRRRASSSSAYGAGEPYSSSISFEDDDAVFAERMHSESGSTACTSEPDASSDDANWGLDGLEEEPDMELDAGMSLLDEAPFEDDVDDFTLDALFAKPAGLAPRMSLPVPMAANSLGAGQDAGSTSSFSSLEPSPRKESHLVSSVPLAASPSSQQSKKTKRKVVKGASPSFC